MYKFVRPDMRVIPLADGDTITYAGPAAQAVMRVRCRGAGIVGVLGLILRNNDLERWNAPLRVSNPWS